MKITVLNGSPKGEISVTMQYVRYIEQEFPQHTLQFVNVSYDIRTLEENPSEFFHVIDMVRNSDGVIWATPTFFFLVHSNFKRFIELIRERKVEDAFSGKYAVVLTSSIHIYDNVTHDYLTAICEDLNMLCTGYFSASMDELIQKSQRERLYLFATDFFNAISKKTPIARMYQPLQHKTIRYIPGESVQQVDSSGKKILLLTDCPEPDSNLEKMVHRLSNAFTGPVEVVDVNRMAIKGGCLGCVHCGFDNQCIYGDSDDICTVYNKKIREADIIIICLRIVDRYFSSRWKMFFDRKFLNTHQPQMINKQIGYIISGPVGQLPQLREIVRFQTEIDRANLAGIVTDEHEKSDDIDSLIDDLASRVVFYADRKYRRPYTFLVEGSGKVCNDLVWGKWRFIYRGDHRFYKAHEMYGYGKSKRKTSRSIINFVLAALCRIPGVKLNIWKKFSEPRSDPFDYLDLLEK